MKETFIIIKIDCHVKFMWGIESTLTGETMSHHDTKEQAINKAKLKGWELVQSFGELHGSKELYEKTTSQELANARTSLFKEMDDKQARLISTIKKAISEFDKIPWGYDGDCGSQRIIDSLESYIEDNHA